MNRPQLFDVKLEKFIYQISRLDKNVTTLCNASVKDN